MTREKENERVTKRKGKETEQQRGWETGVSHWEGVDAERMSHSLDGEKEEREMLAIL